ncbi:MAG TPA: ABC transporter substrate-binding protein [Chitinophagaceae bacterium]|nr:ABC transporter substrate-binding protein [Chitinophagaceae bacterium]
MNQLYKYYQLLIITLSVFLIACNNKERNNKKIFHYNETTGIASLDPAFSKNQSTMWPVHQLFNTLVENDGDIKTKGSLAKNWDISADRLEYFFHLRTDVFFHDNDAFVGGKGKKMTATDVAYSFKRIIDPKLASPGFYIFNNVVDSIEGFKAIDDSTFRLKLLKPYAPILQVLKMTYCSVVPKEVVEKYGSDFRSHPCGTGPFQFVAWEEGLALIFKKNENYFEKDSAGSRLPYLDGIKITFNESKATEFLLFRQKQLDFLNDIDASFKDEILTLKGELRNSWKDKVVLQIHPYLNTEYFGFLVDTTNELIKNSPTRLKKLRQAMNYAIDRRKMILYLRNSLSSPAENGFVPEGMPSFDTSVKGYIYNPVKAKQLLAEAGYTKDKKPAVIKLYTIPIYGEIGSYLAKQFEDAGIPVTVEVVLRSFLFELTSNSKAPFFRGSWIADYADAFNYLSCFYSKNPAPPNYTRYKNPEFDKLIEKAVAEPNDSLRYILYRKADQLLINDAPIIPLWYDRVIRLVQPNISGFEPNNLNWLELRTTKKVN